MTSEGFRMIETTSIIEPKRRTARVVLAIHGFITLAAGVVLVAAPKAIPSFVNVDLAPGGFVLCYFIAGAEFGIAFLSFYAAQCRSTESIRLAVLTVIVFHASTAVLEIYALIQGIDPRLWSNVALRLVVIAVFLYCTKTTW